MTDTAVGEKSFGIVCDSGCDLTPAQLGRLGVALVPHHVNAGQQSWLDRVDVSDDDALERMGVRGADAVVEEAGSDELLAAYQRLVDEGCKTIVSVHSAEALSAMCGRAREAAARLGDATRVEVLDTGTASIGTGIVVERLSAMRAAGVPLEDALLAAREIAAGVRLMFIPASSSRLVRRRARSRHSGLVSRASMLRVRLVGERGLFLVSRGEVTQTVRSTDIADLCGRIAHAMSAVAHAEGSLDYVELYGCDRKALRPLEKPLDTNEFEAERMGVTRVSPSNVGFVGRPAVGVAFVPDSLFERVGANQPTDVPADD